MSRQVNTVETHKQRAMRTQDRTGQDRTGHNKIEGISKLGERNAQHLFVAVLPVPSVALSRGPSWQAHP